MNLKHVIGCFLLSSSLMAFADNSASTSEAQTPEPVENQQVSYETWAQNLWDSLDRQTGTVNIPKASVQLEVPDNFYYLGPDDAEKVLTEIWGNPPGQMTLGMLFPAEMTPFDDDSWGVTIEYVQEGFVSDEDASDIDYADMLEQMKDSTAEYSQSMVSQGYDSIELIGWAEPPHYDAETKKLYWAKELKFGDDELHTLNYNIRVLGRKGYLLLNFIATMDQKPSIDANIDNVLSMATFNEGSKYSDFNPDLDQVAAYGIGALVAGKVAAKAGIFAALLIFAKKFGVFILVGLAALGRKLFSKKK